MALCASAVLSGCAASAASQTEPNQSTTKMCIRDRTVLTNIIVEVLKRATWEKMPTNLLAIIVAMVLTLVAFFGYMAFMGYAVMWYYVAAAVVVGFAVAYAAMFLSLIHISFEL